MWQEESRISFPSGQQPDPVIIVNQLSVSCSTLIKRENENIFFLHQKILWSYVLWLNLIEEHTTVYMYVDLTQSSCYTGKFSILESQNYCLVTFQKTPNFSHFPWDPRIRNFKTMLSASSAIVRRTLQRGTLHTEFQIVFFLVTWYSVY